MDRQVGKHVVLLGQFGNEEPVFNADNVPFLAAGYDNAWKLYQAQKGILEKKLLGRGLVLLYSVAWPGQGLYTKAPLKSGICGDLQSWQSGRAGAAGLVGAPRKRAHERFGCDHCCRTLS